jgi:hypothetical protein
MNASLAFDSREIAVASKRDSSAMKSISILTMTFLPATFVAVCSSLIPPASGSIEYLDCSSDY